MGRKRRRPKRRRRRGGSRDGGKNRRSSYTCWMSACMEADNRTGGASKMADLVLGGEFLLLTVATHVIHSTFPVFCKLNFNLVNLGPEFICFGSSEKTE